MHSASVREAFLLKPRLKNEKTRMERRQGEREIKRWKGGGREREARNGENNARKL